MAKKEIVIPEYGFSEIKGTLYYTRRIQGASGKSVVLYARSREEMYEKEKRVRKDIEEEKFRRANPTVKEYCEKWLLMKSATVKPQTIAGYERVMKKYVIEPIGDMYMSDVTADDLKLLMVPVSKMSCGIYSTLNMLLKCLFYSAEDNRLIKKNPSVSLNARGGKPKKKKPALTDDQVKVLLDTVRDLPPYVFVMLGLYAGLRREEILALEWDCVHLDEPQPYISVRRAWRPEKNRPVISTVLKTEAARRDIPIPKCLADCLREEKEKSISDFVIADSEGQPLSEAQFVRIWHYIKVRTAKERNYYKYINGEKIVVTMNPQLGDHQKNRPDIVYSLDFTVSPHQLRYTYITNLIHANVDPKTVQYLAGHKNSKVTMDVYARVKYNKPEELSDVVNAAFDSGGITR